MTSRGTQYWSNGTIPLIAPELLGDIIAAAADIAVVISDMGQVMSVLVNPNHFTFGRLDHWEGRNIRDFLTSESVTKLDLRLEDFATGSAASKPIEMNHTDDPAWEFPIRYSFHRVGPDGALLMLGRDLQPIAEMQQQLVKAQLALERDYEAQREFDTRLRVIMDSTRDAIVFISLGTGRIMDLNTAAASLLGDSVSNLTGAPFVQEFDGRQRGEFLDTLENSAVAESRAPVELTARRTGRALLVATKVFRAAGERLLLCRLDVPENDTDDPDLLSRNIATLFADGVDAMLFTDADGTIQSVNEAFLNLVDVAHPNAVKGKSLAEYLARGSIDLKVLIENAARVGQMRLYATKLSTEHGGQVSVEISATYLDRQTLPSVAFVIRDASRVDAMRTSAAPGSDEGVRSVMELVGSATLKDIVAETTDVVEKMCIETAVELTRNNRVAAAEMLGLSRQSLYVKLRKYDLLSRTPD